MPTVPMAEFIFSSSQFQGLELLCSRILHDEDVAGPESVFAMHVSSSNWL